MSGTDRKGGEHRVVLRATVPPEYPSHLPPACTVLEGIDADEGLEWCGGPEALAAFEREHGVVTSDSYEFGDERGSVSFARNDYSDHAYATLSAPKASKTKKPRKRAKMQKAQTAPSGGEAGAAAQLASGRS